METKKEPLKEAFFNIKKDIDFLNSELLVIRTTLEDLKEYLKLVGKNQLMYEQKLIFLNKLIQTDKQTIRQINTTHSETSTDNPTVPQEIGGFKDQNLGVSTGNKGVPTDRQTIRQTDNLTENLPKIRENNTKNMDIEIREVSEMLSSLGNLKREIRLKFKRLTPQEMLVFTTIYQFEEQKIDEIDYKMISDKLSLSQSSIRDYVQRMVKKGIPIQKIKINNKKIVLSISSDLKNIASLATIIKLKEL